MRQAGADEQALGWTHAQTCLGERRYLTMSTRSALASSTPTTSLNRLVDCTTGCTSTEKPSPLGNDFSSTRVMSTALVTIVLGAKELKWRSATAVHQRHGFYLTLWNLSVQQAVQEAVHLVVQLPVQLAAELAEERLD